MSYCEQAQDAADADDPTATDSVTHELAARPVRAPDYAAENRALGALAQEFAQHPESLPQRLAELLRELCRAGSAGISVPGPEAGSLQWSVASGAFAGREGTSVPDIRNAQDRNAPVLLRDTARACPMLPAAEPPAAEMLLVPWTIGGQAMGTVWVASHDPACRFDAEDARLLRSLSGFAAAAYRAGLVRRDLERSCADRTEELEQANARLADEVAQRAAAERELRESHAILQAAMETEAVGLAFYTLDGRIIDCNEALARMCGYSRRDLRSSIHWSDMTAPEFVDTTTRVLDELREGGRAAPYMKQMVRRNGTRWWAMVAPACLPGEGPERKCIAFVVDITESREAEAALRASEERFQTLVRGFAQAIWEANPDGSTHTDSPSWRRFTGQSTGEFLGHGWINAVHPDDRHYLLRHWHEASNSGMPVNAEYRVRQADGSWRWTNVRAAPLRNPDGSVARWIGMNIDVDARRQAEAALRESQRRFQALAEASPALI